jgi:SNF2 family DNA or RNA helicase
MDIKLSFSTIAMEDLKNPFEILVISKKGQSVDFQYDRIDNKGIFARYKNPAWDFIAEYFDNRTFLLTRHQFEQHYIKLNLDVDKNEYIRKNIYKYIFDVFNKIKQSKWELKTHVKFKLPDGAIRNYPSTFYFDEVIMSFDIHKDTAGGIHLQPVFHIEGSTLDSNEVQLLEFFVFHRNFFYLLSDRDYQTLLFLKKKNVDKYRFDPVGFSNDILIDLEKKYHVERHNYFPEEDIKTKPERQLLLSESAGFLMIHPQWYYDGILIEGKYEPKVSIYKNGIKYHIHRDKEEELSFVEILKGFSPDFKNQINGYFFIGVENAKKKNWFLKFYHALLEQNIDIVGMDLLKNFRYSKFPIHTEMHILELLENNLKIQFKASFGEEKLNVLELQKTLQSKQRSILLSDNTIGVLDDEWIEKYALLIKHSTVEKDTLRVPKWIALFQKSIFESIATEEQFIEANWWSQWRLWQEDEMILHPVDPSIKASLRPYQQKGYEWMILLNQLGAGACLADDMGLGKTLQTICFLNYRKHKNTAKKHLIISPASLIYNWKMEIEKFAPEMSVAVYHSANRDFAEIGKHNPDVIITSYGTARVDIELLNEIGWNTIVLDESHNIKNPQAQVTKAIATLMAEMRVILSGTPIMNQTFDLYPQLSFILPSLFGSKEFFAKEYAYPIDKDRDKEKIEMLKRITNPFILRRTKEQVAKDLPQKTESIIWCEMGSEQRKIYTEVKQNIKDSIFLDIQSQGLAKSKLSVLAGIQKLRQICSSPALLTDFENKTSESIKIEILIDEIKGNLKDNKVIVFSQFLNALDIIKDKLTENQIAFYSIDGSTPNAKRQEQINQFQDKENPVRVFLLSLKAGNAGITLTEANYVFLIDPWWNRQVEQQAIDRVYRIGQDKNVFAYRMICKDTIEEKIIKLQQSKMSLSEELISEDDGFVKNLSENDLEFLFE